MKGEKRILIIVLVLIVVLSLFGGFGIMGFGRGMMGGYYGGFYLFNEIINILIIVLVILGIYWLIKNINFDRRRKR